MNPKEISLGARVPRTLKKKLDHFCHEHGLKMSFVVMSALEDKLGELEEELVDKALAWKRLESAEFVGQEDYDQYFKTRFAKH